MMKAGNLTVTARLQELSVPGCWSPGYVLCTDIRPMPPSSSHSSYLTLLISFSETKRNNTTYVTISAGKSVMAELGIVTMDCLFRLQWVHKIKSGHMTYIQQIHQFMVYKHVDIVSVPPLLNQRSSPLKSKTATHPNRNSGWYIYSKGKNNILLISRLKYSGEYEFILDLGSTNFKSTTHFFLKLPNSDDKDCDQWINTYPKIIRLYFWVWSQFKLLCILVKIT